MIVIVTVVRMRVRILLPFALLHLWSTITDASNAKWPHFDKTQDGSNPAEASSTTFLDEMQPMLQHFRLSPFHMELPQNLKDFLQQCYHILLYKPPVGIVTVFAAARLILTGRIFRLYQEETEMAAEGVLRLEETKKRHRKRRSALHLDTDDRSYDSYGGVQQIRRKLCISAMNVILKENPSQKKHAAMEAIQVTYQPGGGGGDMFNHVEHMALPLATLERIIALEKEQAQATTMRMMQNNNLPLPTDADSIIEMTAKVAEIRALDALLRLSRDELLKTSSRLHRLVKYWNHRVALSSNMGYFLQAIMKESIEADRLRLAFANAAFKAEITRLGTVQHTLSDRLDDIQDQDLIMVLSKSSIVKRDLPALSRFALRWNTDGKGRLTIRYHDEDMEISSEAALQLLLTGSVQGWIDQAHKWTSRARTVISQILEDSMDSSWKSKKGHDAQLAIVQAWQRYDVQSNQIHWKTVLALVDGISEHSRVGEGRIIGIADARQWTKRIDIFGIPSSLAAVGLARLTHYYLLPKWPNIRSNLIQLYMIVWGIIEMRFWYPLKGIILDLMNKRPSLLEAFDVQNEETSLDNMLRDLGFGDGTASSRKESLIQAARQYESDLNNGLFRNAMRGRLIRLLLVQIQQLKAGLLSAMVSIDVLVEANQLNIQLLTAIPAVLLVSLGTRFFVRSLYSLRMKDIRPIHDVHAEMAALLDQMETRVLLASGESFGLSGLTPMELGDFVLNMHSYLVLLDFCSPPFSGQSCNAIHISMQQLLSMQGKSRGTNVHAVMLQLVKQKHMDLLKYL